MSLVASKTWPEKSIIRKRQRLLAPQMEHSSVPVQELSSAVAA
jgi:hypothetical protein